MQCTASFLGTEKQSNRAWCYVCLDKGCHCYRFAAMQCVTIITMWHLLKCSHQHLQAAVKTLLSQWMAVKLAYVKSSIISTISVIKLAHFTKATTGSVVRNDWFHQITTKSDNQIWVAGWPVVSVSQWQWLDYRLSDTARRWGCPTTSPRMVVSPGVRRWTEDALWRLPFVFRDVWRKFVPLE